MAKRRTTQIREPIRHRLPAYCVTASDRQAYQDGCRLVRDAGQRVCDFFPRFLVHSQGKWSGQAFELAPWQSNGIIMPLFGWLRPDGTRRFRRAYISVPKKNGKSTLAAGVGLYLLIGDGEQGAHVYSAATKLEQAAIVHDEAVKMVRGMRRRSAAMARHLRVHGSTKTITFAATMSKYAAIGKDSEGAEGLNIHGLIADELHVWKGRAFWDSLRYGFAARAQPLSFTITTAGIYDPTSLGFQEYEYAKKILTGTVDIEELVYIREADKDCRIEDRAQHRKANPSYGLTIDPDELAKAARDATQKPTEVSGFLRYRLNQWVATAEAFFDMGSWLSLCSDPVDEAALARSRRQCIAGLDLASTVDVGAWVLLFPPTKRDPKFRVVCRFFVPDATAARREELETVPYVTWSRQGAMILTPGPVIDFGVIRKTILADMARFNVREIAADPWNLEGLRQNILEYRDAPFVAYPQSFQAMSPAVKELQRLVIAGLFAHGGHPVLGWMAGNAVPIEDGNGNIRLSRRKSRDKIDGIIAVLMALGRYILHTQQGGKKSVYEERKEEEKGGGETGERGQEKGEVESPANPGTPAAGGASERPTELGSGGAGEPAAGGAPSADPANPLEDDVCLALRRAGKSVYEAFE